MQTFLIEHANLRLQRTRIQRDYRIAAVVADRSACFETHLFDPQAVKILRLIVHAVLAVKNCVHTAAGRIKFNDPVGIAQRFVDAACRHQRLCSALLRPKLRRTDIVQRRILPIAFRINRRDAQRQDIVSFCRIIQITPAAGCQLGQTVLRDHVDGLRFAVQLLLAQLFLHLHKPNSRHAKKHSENRNDQQDLRHGKSRRPAILS